MIEVQAARVQEARCAGAPALFLGLLLEGFYLAPRGMGAIPNVATASDVDDLAASIGHVLMIAEDELNVRLATPASRVSTSASTV